MNTLKFDGQVYYRPKIKREWRWRLAIKINWKIIGLAAGGILLIADLAILYLVLFRFDIIIMGGL